MRILWLCNMMLPAIATSLGKEAGNKEGWLTGLFDKFITYGEGTDLELGICFPIAKGSAPLRGEIGNIRYFGFPEDTNRPESYDAEIEKYLTEILETFQPDIVHVFGTEYPHTLAMTRCMRNKEKLLIGIQGLCSAIAEAYMADLPKEVQNRFLFRDMVKQDNIRQQQEKFRKRGTMEKEALQNALHVTGRTKWDREKALEINPALTYHFMNETLRSPFYQNKWSMEKAVPYRIFLSQGNYPLKGLHCALQALPEICREFPLAKLYVAGDKITAYETWKDKIKISSYGKYCMELIKEKGLQDKVVFLGRLDGEAMCRQYLSSHLLLSASFLENSSNSVGEAMLLGMPVVSSEVGGIPSMLTDKKEGLFFKAGDSSALSEAVCTLFVQKDLAAAYGEQARKRALMTHDGETNFNRLLEIYQSL